MADPVRLIEASWICARPQSVGQGAHPDEWHHQISMAVGFAIIPDRHDIRVGKLGDKLRLAPETPAETGLAGQLRGKHLQRAEAIRLRIVGLVYRGHPPAAD